MKSFIKKLSCYPVTLLDAVYFKGSNKSLQQAIDNNEFFGISNLETLKTLIGNQVDKLVTYKGNFNYSLYFNNKEFRESSSKGDFWINKNLQQYNVDMSVLKPHGIVYFDGEYFKTIDVPYYNDNKPSGQYDVCIVGGGAGGIGAAYALRDSGWRVAIVERLDELGGTHCNAGVGLFLASPICGWYKSLAENWYEKGIFSFMAKSPNKNVLGVGDGTDFDKAFRAAQYVDEKGLVNSFKGNFLTINDYKMSQEYYNDFKDTIDIFINCELVNTVSSDAVYYTS